ncbi:hypothetical protein QTP86_015666 [Hemibagrus guttatus]|nr:hypothetical protein QTP86_015666 [Hemibagrus guttatus]
MKTTVQVHYTQAKFAPFIVNFERAVSHRSNADTFIFRWRMAHGDRPSFQLRKAQISRTSSTGSFAEAFQGHIFCVLAVFMLQQSEPGFYSPKIPRSRPCEFSMTKTTKEYDAHTLPLPHTKLAVFKQRQVDTKSKNVFGQPRVIATLRSGCTPRPVRKTTVVEDLKKLILMDDTTDSPTQTSRSATECLQDSSSPKPLMFSSPVLTRHPVPRPNHLSLQSDPSLYQQRCGLSDTLVWDQDVRFDQEPLNLPNTACKLDWTSLVNAAEAYETQEMANLLAGESRDIQSGTSPETHSPHLPHSLSEASDDNVFIDFPDQLSHLEAMLMRLSTDLLKEKKDKVALLAEVLKLRMSNQHLKEESLSANAQLHKICQMFSINPESVE